MNPDRAESAQELLATDASKGSGGVHASGRPPAEIHLDDSTVRAMLEAERPSLAAQPLSLVDEGWDNFIFRLGESRAVRLPRRSAAVELLVKEQRWLPLLAPRLPLAVPFPLHAGRPSDRFAWPWSVVTWIAGRTAEGHHLGDADVATLVETLLALHRAAPEDAPVNPRRGVPLRERAQAVEGRLHRLHDRKDVDASRLGVIWRIACATPVSGSRTWVHGDLHPRNVVVRNGSVVGLIDWGDLSGGDIATDVAGAWTLFDEAVQRQRFLRGYGAPEELVLRASGWAVYIGLALVESGEPRHVKMGLAALDRVVADMG